MSGSSKGKQNGDHLPGHQGAVQPMVAEKDQQGDRDTAGPGSQQKGVSRCMEGSTALKFGKNLGERYWIKREVAGIGTNRERSFS